MQWHHTPLARAVLASITPNDLSLYRAPAIVGEDYFEIIGTPVGMLRAIREATAIQALGCSFRTADEQGRAREFLAAMGPEPQAVLADLFGEPPHYWRSHDARAVEAAWKAGWPVERREAA